MPHCGGNSSPVSLSNSEVLSVREVLRGICGRKGKQFRRQDMCLYRISFLGPFDGNICLLTPTLTHNGSTPSAAHWGSESCQWGYKVSLEARVHGEDREFGKSRNADADSRGPGRTVAWASLFFPEEPLCVSVVVYMLVNVFACSY